MKRVVFDVGDVDWKMLREQKAALVELRGECDRRGDARTVELDGLVHLLDFLQDEAAKVVGEESVFGAREGDAK